MKLGVNLGNILTHKEALGEIDEILKREDESGAPVSWAYLKILEDEGRLNFHVKVEDLTYDEAKAVIVRAREMLADGFWNN